MTYKMYKMTSSNESKFCLGQAINTCKGTKADQKAALAEDEVHGEVS